jgi:hypothetical protein
MAELITFSYEVFRRLFEGAEWSLAILALLTAVAVGDMLRLAAKGRASTGADEKHS